MGMVLTAIKRLSLGLFQGIASVYLGIQEVIRRSHFYLNILSALSCFIICVLLLLDIGFHLNTENKILFDTIYKYLLIYFSCDLGFRLFVERHWIMSLISKPTEICIIVLVVGYLFYFQTFDMLFVTKIGLFFVMIGRVNHFKHLLAFFKLKPAQIFPLGFLFTIFIGSLLLSLPLSTTNEQGMRYLDALFTVFSAVCVTGLNVVDVGTTFTLFGQSVILLLIQIGGLGIMTFAMLLTRLLNKRVSTRDSLDFQESYSTVTLNDTFKTIGFIFKLTIVIELIGAVSLAFLWNNDFASLNQTLFYALFHSISAFCNAGFSLFPDSLVSYGTNMPIVLVMASLIIIGGIGFPVLFNIIEVWKSKKSFRWLRLQTKMVLWMSAALIVIGTLIILCVEYNHGLLPFNLRDKVIISFFQSVSSRTAGFNTIDLNYFYPGTLLMMIALMMIGASPGSTGGGIKTTSFSIIILSFLNTLKSSKKLVLSGRTIDESVILKSFALFFLAFMIIFLFLFAILFIEKGSFLNLLFETVSAFGTVGYSLGLTPLLSNIGKVLIMILMFIGRIGPLSLAFALSRSKSEVKYSYPKENIAIV